MPMSYEIIHIHNKQGDKMGLLIAIGGIAVIIGFGCLFNLIIKDKK